MPGYFFFSASSLFAILPHSFYSCVSVLFWLNTFATQHLKIKWRAKISVSAVKRIKAIFIHAFQMAWRGCECILNLLITWITICYEYYALLTIFWGARAWWGITAQVIARIGILMHRRKWVAQRTSRTRKARVLAPLRSEMLIATAYRTVAMREKVTLEWLINNCTLMLLEKLLPPQLPILCKFHENSGQNMTMCRSYL